MRFLGLEGNGAWMRLALITLNPRRAHVLLT